MAPATINREVAMIKHMVGLAAAGALEGVKLDRATAAAICDVPIGEPGGR